jgi:hypothetical protein
MCPKGKGEVFPVYAMNAHRGSRGIAPLILDLRTDGGQWLTQHPASFTPRK